MALSTLLCRVPVLPVRPIELLDRFQTRRVRSSQITKLSNGLTVVTARGLVPHSLVGIYSRAGSRYEDIDHPRGIAWLANRHIRSSLLGRRWLVDGGVNREFSWITLESPEGTTKDSISSLAEVIAAPKITESTIRDSLPALYQEMVAFRASKWREYEDLCISRAFETTGLGNSPLPEHAGSIDALSTREGRHPSAGPRPTP